MSALQRVAWDEDRVRRAFEAGPSAPLAALAREAGWSRTRLRRRVAGWKRDSKIGSAPPANMITGLPTPALRPADGRPVGRVLAAVAIASIGVSLAGIGMAATITYSIEAAGTLMAALAAAADTMTLVLPATACALWRARRHLLAVAAWTMWTAAAGITVANVAGFIGQHTDSFLGARELASTEHALVLERLGRLRAERATITEPRPAGAIAAVIHSARRAEIEKLRIAMAIAVRRDEIDRDLAALEPRLRMLPAVTMIDPSASVLADILRLPSEIDLRRIRLALCLVLPLTGGLVLALALAVGAATILPEVL